MTRYSKELKQLFCDLIHGETFGHLVDIQNPAIAENGETKLFWTNLKYNPIYNMFNWQYFGSSAEKADLCHLNWLLTTIFKCTPTEFRAQYITRSEAQKMPDVLA